ncbi:NAD(P)-dependent oxidoreductase [Dialister succinatiphilus]|uniref:NAD(P)-dependent oxidoreductase n=1 Tax=Dialister succinatiphilus TaxID=487173 RepID=UPI003F7F8AA2
MMKEIVIAQPLGVSKETLDTLLAPLTDRGYHLTLWDSLPESQDDLGNRISKADLAVIANYPLKKEALDKASSLKYLCVAFTGVDHVDIDTCSDKGIAVSNCAGYSTESVAELAIGMMLSLYRKLAEGKDAAAHGKTGAGLRGIEIKDRTVGIIGTGAIGYRTANLAKAFGAKVIGYNRSHSHDDITYTDLNTLLQTSDIVSIHLPLTKDTKHFIDKDKLSLMKKDAILINTARGGIIDNEALAEALKKGEIAGAGIDVFDMEPPLPEDYPLLSAPHTVLTPHVGFDTEEAMERRAAIVADNLKSFVEGKQKNIIC